MLSWILVWIVISLSLPVKINSSSFKSNLIPVKTGKGLFIETALETFVKAFNNSILLILKFLNL